MKNIDIENLYRKIDGHINLIVAYTGEKYLSQLIRSFRLKPDSCFAAGFDYDTRLERCWCDEFGGSVRLIDKRLKIVLNDLKTNKNANTTTDLFYGNSIQTIAMKSKFALIARCEYDFVAFYGIDEFIRAFIRYENKWIRISPLVMGLNTAKIMFANINRARKELDVSLCDFVVPFRIDTIYTMPLSNKEDIVSFLNNKTGE